MWSARIDQHAGHMRQRNRPCFICRSHGTCSHREVIQMQSKRKPRPRPETWELRRLEYLQKKAEQAGRPCDPEEKRDLLYRLAQKRTIPQRIIRGDL